MPPLEAIRAATMNAAELMGWEDKVGALEPGHYADVIAVEADPLTDITQLQHVQWVMKGGIVIKDAPPPRIEDICRRLSVSARTSISGRQWLANLQNSSREAAACESPARKCRVA
jgi:adenine deaminase